MREKLGMKLSWILLIVVWLGFAPMDLGDKTFCYPTGNCYKVLITELQFSSANVSCGPNGSLPTMKTELEKKEILQFATNFTTRRNVNEFWIGLYQPDTNCTEKDNNLYGFIWISGEDDTEVSEWNNIPKKKCTTKKKCVLLQSKWGATDSGLQNLTWFWKNDKCGRKLPSICRFPILPTDHSKELMTFPAQTTVIPSTINVQCRESRGNETVTCVVENIRYSCNDTLCFCEQMDDKGGGYGLSLCQENLNESCLGQCIRSSNISCVCEDHQTSCDRAECTINATTSTSPMVHSTTSSPSNDDENLFDGLIIPLILGLVALGILIMLMWGGVQMCVRKKKPKRRKSIIPTIEPEVSDTDSTDNSSSDEEGDSQDMAEMA